jgi:hypothetical protein
MNLMKSLLLLVMLSVGGCAPILAQPWEVAVTGNYFRFGKSALGSYSTEDPKDDDTRIKPKSGFGARFTMNTRGYYGHEAGYFYNRAELRATTRTVVDRVTTATTQTDNIVIQQGFYNFLMYMMPRGERWRPFLTGGLQMYQYGRPSLAGVETRSSRHYGGNFGGGIKLKLAPNLLIRADFRDYIGGKPYGLKFANDRFSGGLVQWLEFSFGVGITF